MIIDLPKFISLERPYWNELESMLDSMEKEPNTRLDLNVLRRFHYLYQRASADLVKITTFAANYDLRRYLESLVERAYGEIHETRRGAQKLKFRQWFLETFPQTFRRHIKAFWLSLALFMAGFAFGGMAISFDTGAKDVLLTMSHLRISPSERVAKEEKGEADRLEGVKSRFSSYLMTHNTRVGIVALALGMTYGVGTIIILFANGVLLGAVALDYILAGEGVFLVGWLLPHGSIEIPAILLAAQAGLVLAGALIGWGRPTSLRSRLREISGDIVTLIFGVALMLVWAGIVEAFFSQYHEPILPYWIKISFGSVELILLTLFLSRSGVKKKQPAAKP